MEDDDLGQLRHPSKTLQADIQRMCSMEGGAKRSGSGLTEEEKRIIHGECAEKDKRLMYSSSLRKRSIDVPRDAE